MMFFPQRHTIASANKRMHCSCVCHRPDLSRLAVACLLALTAFATPASAQTSNQTTPFPAASETAEPTGRLIIKYTEAESPWQSPRGSKRVTRSGLREQRKLTFARKMSGKRELVQSEQMRGGLKALKAEARSLSTEPDIEYAAIEYRRYSLAEPNDPLYQGTDAPGNQAYLFDGEYSVHTPGAWDISTGSTASVIAIVDTGVLPDHPDVADREVPGLGYDFVSADAPNNFFSANDGDGRDADPADPGDPCEGGSASWHGTSVASVAAGNSNNSEGLAGIDWNARLLHARALGICGGTDADIIDAVRWSAGLTVDGIPDNPNPANVVNLSLGGATECTTAWQDVIDELAALNVIFVMAAGNERQNTLRSSPANCANVIAVGSNTLSGDIDSRFSNHGVKVTVSTSGRDIVVASNSGFDTPDEEGNFYRTETGTSFSAAIVSGAISLMHSLNPDLGPAEVRALLQDSATPFATDSDCDTHYCGGGIMNLSRAMTMLRDNNFSAERDIALEQIANQSQPVELETRTDATLFGFKDIRYFSLQVPERGLLQAESSGSADLYGYLLNAELSVIALDDDGGNATNFRVASLVDPGTYYIAVERERHRRIDAELNFALSTSLSDDQPDAFTFNSVSDATASATVESNIITVSGLQSETILTISNGFYSLNGSAANNLPTTVRNGDTLQVAIQSASSENRSNTATVTVGTFTTNFTVTTAANTRITSTTGSATDGNNTGSGSFNLSILFAVLLVLSLKRRISKYHSAD